MRKKYTLLILLLAGTSMAAMAQNGGRSINVLYIDGSDHVMSMSDVERIEIGNDDINVVSKNGATKKHKKSDINGIWLNGTTSGICNRVRHDGDITLTVTGENITITGASPKANVSLYNTAGRSIVKSVCSDGRAIIGISNLHAGTYIVKVDGMTQKFIKKQTSN